MRPVYFNENNQRAAVWLRWLIDQGLLPRGHVDDRSIRDVQPGDLAGYAQHHFFAGIGGWALAALLAGWPAGRPLWSASCPCQPFSAAGRRQGADDDRHLWPDLFRLIGACRPATIVGEQVSSALGYGWFDGVRADLGAASYASRACDVPAAAMDSPQIRQRLYWLGIDTRAAGHGAGGSSEGPCGLCEGGPLNGPWRPGPGVGDEAGCGPSDASGAGHGAGAYESVVRQEPSAGQLSINEQDGGVDGQCGALAGSAGLGSGGGRQQPQRGPQGRTAASGDDAREHDAGRALDSAGGHAGGAGSDGVTGAGSAAQEFGRSDGRAGAAQGCASSRRLEIGKLTGWSGAAASRWIDAAGADDRNGSWWAGSDWILCHDDKARRVADAGAPLLVAGFPGRVAAWSGVGNAICVPLAVEHLKAVMETT